MKFAANEKAGYHAIPRADMLSNAGTGNPTERERRYNGVTVKKATEGELTDEK